MDKEDKDPMIWAFDLGKGSIGEAVRQGTDIKHKASLLIPPELARRGPASVSGTPASKYRAMKTRQAHHERERWLEKVWSAAGLLPLRAREVWENPATGKWELKQKADFRLEREFAPRELRRNSKGEWVAFKYPTGKASDGAPATTKGDFQTCYTSSLLRIRLLQGDETLSEWQIYKALRAALQRRGYGPVPWAVKEARKLGKTPEEVEREEEKKLERADARYRDAVGKWPDFKRSAPKPFHFPCYFDAWKMGLWDPSRSEQLLSKPNHLAKSTRNIRFDRIDVRAELIRLGDQAATLLPRLKTAFAMWQRDGWRSQHPVTGAQLVYRVGAKTFGEFLCDGPVGTPDETSFEAFLKQRRAAGLNRGSFEEWMAALGQKTPAFDNRILKNCVLIPRFHVCKVDARLETNADGIPTGKLAAESLLAMNVTLLLKLKNLWVADPGSEGGQRRLKVEEIRDIINWADRRVSALELVAADGKLLNNWPTKVAHCFSISKSDWPDIARESEFLRTMTAGEFLMGTEKRRLSTDEAVQLLQAITNPKRGLETKMPKQLQLLTRVAKSQWKKAKIAWEARTLRPMPGHEEVKAPKSSGRCAYSRVALRILKALILSGDAPSAFYGRIIRREPELLRRLGSSAHQPLVIFEDSSAKDEKQRHHENTEYRKRGLLISELYFLRQMRRDNADVDSWENIFIPSQTVDALQQRHTRDGKLDCDAAIRELLGTINDPIVRHRLSVFADRLRKLQHGEESEELPGFGVPDAVVLEFVREDFMGEEAKREYQNFINERERDRKTAREEAGKLGLESRSSGLRYELWKAQGCICLYTGKPLAETELDQYEIDHIVPRSLGGPDAMVNYVLTFHEVNHTKEKGKLTPFGLLNGKEGWDSYVKRVHSCATALRNKKVQLLTRSDAAELVQRYTALAETAWVSKLAQAIVNLRFGWTNGYDEKREKRVIVVSGGLTARVRRKYGLDKLLYRDVTDPEALSKKVKNREDKRHHALDAMVLTFIPQWARDPNKEGFFRLPRNFRDSNGREDFERVQQFFNKHLSEVMPKNIAFERAALADTSFGIRDDGEKSIIVKRIPVFDLGQEPAGAPGKTKFSLKYLTKKTEWVRDATVRRRLKEFIEEQPDEAGWRRFCESFTQKRKDGTAGARIIKVWVYAGEPDEFKDLSKDGTGAMRKAKDDHQGQIIFTDGNGELAVKPVYAHASIKEEMKRIAGVGGGSKVYCFVRSRCSFRLGKEIPESDYGIVVKNEQKQKRRIGAKTPLQPATFTLNTIISKSMDVEFSAANGQRLVAPLRVLVEARFTPV
jgi:hypothetical protein